MKIQSITATIRVAQRTLYPLIDPPLGRTPREVLRAAKPRLDPPRVWLTYEGCYLTRTYKQGVWTIHADCERKLANILEDLRVIEFCVDRGHPFNPNWRL